MDLLGYTSSQPIHLSHSYSTSYSLECQVDVQRFVIQYAVMTAAVLLKRSVLKAKTQFSLFVACFLKTLKGMLSRSRTACLYWLTLK